LHANYSNLIINDHEKTSFRRHSYPDDFGKMQLRKHHYTTFLQNQNLVSGGLGKLLSKCQFEEM